MIIKLVWMRPWDFHSRENLRMRRPHLHLDYQGTLALGTRRVSRHIEPLGSRLLPSSLPIRHWTPGLAGASRAGRTIRSANHLLLVSSIPQGPNRVQSDSAKSALKLLHRCSIFHIPQFNRPPKSMTVANTIPISYGLLRRITRIARRT